MKVIRKEPKVVPIGEVKPGTTFEVPGHEALFLRTAHVPNMPDLRVNAVALETGQLAVIPEETIVTIVPTQVEIVYE